MDIMVAATQDWLRAHYASKSWFWADCPQPGSANYGKTGWHTIYALLRVFQYIVGIPEASITNNFGDGTSSKYTAYGLMKRTLLPKHDPLHQVLQGALWCKGYSTGKYLDDNEDYLDDTFDGDVEYAVKVLQEHAGVAQTGVVSVNLMKALLSMDYFKTLEGTSYNADPKVREFQQFMNGRYENYIGIKPCDGVYGRETNKALIYAIQAEEKIPVGTANGNFGNATQSCLPFLPYSGTQLSYVNRAYTADEIAVFTKIMNFGLYVNGFGDGPSETFSSQTVRDFQEFYKLNVTGVCDKGTWMSICISKGDVNRSAQGFDTATRLDQARINTLKNLGYTTAGRYLSNFPTSTLDKRMTREELQLILSNNMRYFCIYQESLASQYLTAAWFTTDRAQYDARRALEAAYQLGIPNNAIIYFAVDFDAMGHEISGVITSYFRVIKSVFQSLLAPYRIGVYGPRLLCRKMAEQNLTMSSFVADMSTGFSGNLGYKIPDNWAFDQFHEYTVGSGAGSIGIDKVAISGRYPGENSITAPIIDPPLPYETPPILDTGVETGGGHCGFFVNTSEAPLPVSAELINHIVMQPGEVTGHINSWECFTMSRAYRMATESVYAIVWYRDENGNMAQGYVRTGYFPDADPEDADLVWQKELFNCQVGFGRYIPNETGSGQPLVPITTEHPRNVGGATRFVLAGPAQVFTPHKYNSTFHTYLNSGDEVLVDRQPGIGSRAPWRIVVLKYRKSGSGAWLDFFPEGFEDGDNPGTLNPDLTWAWMDTRLDFGTSPSNRLLR